ncbi:hypothetical protein [Methylobacterium haplocladii]|uniref:Uncharacterized protein n=1 Tax=Methylobacterium haplocladii TaxID=1176176 RepID=A0A512IS37_9HYPH|nr:hypothetical protein [Methylobacterium haplocladii]GEP00501.1 hypothetical protein MHA02_28880 [Methylobacterium haplocladii]GJD82477.1 hypothetical protein HPGCJGGD_0333 [Methylobacterium haplocladii]GLS59562.1 hypothetical protein GCM10007887_22310 [Methylobacterium haplocladii]
MWPFGHGDGVGDTIAADCLVMAKIVPQTIGEKLGAVASARQKDIAR